ncbi:MAG: hypothetical protein RLZZ458_2362 [Planctomycetota bacterium]|jgi:hypothetical protein
MKKEQARRWLTQRLKSQEKFTLASVAGLTALGTVAWSLELSAATLVLYIGFLSSTFAAFIVAAAILAAVQYLTILRLPQNLGDVRAVQKISEESQSEFSTAQPLSAVWMYAFGSMDSDQLWYEKLLGLLCLPQRLWAAAWFAWKRIEELKQLNLEACAAVIRHLYREAERVEIDELVQKLNLANPVRLIRQVSLIDGVVLLTRKTPGLSLAQRLVDDINEWLKQNPATTTATAATE